MRNVLGMAAVVASVWWAALGCQRAEALELVKDGKACATIVVADNAGEYQRWAAGWLQEYIEKATGAKLEIVPENKAPAEAVMISVGQTELAKKAGLQTGDLKYDGCKLFVAGKTLYLLGRDYVPAANEKPDNAPDPGNGKPQGTIRAVTAFLEDIAGVRWFLPGPEGIVIPQARSLSVPDTLNKKVVPMLAYTGIGRVYDTAIACYANNGRYAIKFHLYGGDGTWELCVPHKEYAKTHPEYFIMGDSGKRLTDLDQSMLCTSNREVWKVMLKKLQEIYDQGYDGVELGQSDGWQPCLCPECQKEFGDGRIPVDAEHPAERVWTMHKWLCDELAKSHPAKKVVVTAYGPSSYPSKKFDSLPENVVMEMCCPVDSEVWRGRLKSCVDYCSCGSNDGSGPAGFVPNAGPEWIQKHVRMWRDHGVMGSGGGGCDVCLGLGGPAFYAYAKLTADPDVDLDKLLEEYCSGIYGEAGPAMERFFKLLHSRSDLTLEPGRGFKNGYRGEDAFCSLYPPSVVNQLDKLLQKAENVVKSERAKGWLKYTRDCFDGLKTISGMFTAKRAFELWPTTEMLQRVREKVDEFEKWRERIIAYSADKAYIQRWFPQYYGLLNTLLCDGDAKKWDHMYYHRDDLEKVLEKAVKGEKKVRGTGVGPATVLEPLTWNFDKMMANIGHLREEKLIHVKRAPGKPGPDGALDPAAWANTKSAVFEMYHAALSALGKDKETSVRVLYDDERLYARFECREPNLEKMILKTVGRDGDVYGQDEVELFLNPECSNRKYLHLMAAPVKDATYDERLGYITDRLDPRYNEDDISWNADWTYTYKLDQENKLWILEMAVTFKSLGVATPKPGAVWTANFARARRASGGEELSCWVAEDFKNPEVFGELMFDEK